MILLLRALVRLLGFLLLIALALVGLGFALAALLGDELGVSLTTRRSAAGSSAWKATAPRYSRPSSAAAWSCSGCSC